jgi:hypothetical protein
VLVEDESKLPSKKVAKLKCLDCGDVLSAVNPSNVAKDHFNETGDCKKGGLQAKRSRTISSPGAASSSKEAVTMAELDDAPDEQPQQRTMDSYTIPPRQAASAVHEFIKGLITCSTPSAIENAHFKKAFAILGVPNLPSTPS